MRVLASGDRVRGPDAKDRIRRTIFLAYDIVQGSTHLGRVRRHLSKRPAARVQAWEPARPHDSALEAGAANVRRLIADANKSQAWERWPDELWTLTELEELRLNQGLLSKVPSDIGKLTKLRVLELAFRFQFFEPGLGELANLRELIIRGPEPLLKPDLAKLSLERLTIAANWTDSAFIIARIPVTKNVTLTDNHPLAAEDLEREDLSAWRDLEELEIDAWEDFEPTVFQRKLPKCGFSINRKRRVDWEI